MSFALSFSPEFFLAEGEPYDRSDLAVNSAGLPISVWSALAMMPKDRWASMAREVFGLDNPDLLTPETVLEKIEETDTCGTLSVPVDVWIDSDGYYTVEVYDRDRDTPSDPPDDDPEPEDDPNVCAGCEIANGYCPRCGLWDGTE